MIKITINKLHKQVEQERELYKKIHTAFKEHQKNIGRKLNEKDIISILDELVYHFLPDEEIMKWCRKTVTDIKNKYGM